MKKGIVYPAIIILLIVLSSCNAYIDISGQKEYEAYQDKYTVGVLELTTNHYKTIRFNKGLPGKISNSEVIGVSKVKAIFKPGATDSIIFQNTKPVPQYVWKNGKKYKIIHRDELGFTCTRIDTTRIPFSEIKQMHIKKFETGKTVLLAGGIAGGLVGLVYLIAYLTFDINIDLSM
jgi:hypothetical protein